MNIVYALFNNGHQRVPDLVMIPTPRHRFLLYTLLQTVRQMKPIQNSPSRAVVGSHEKFLSFHNAIGFYIRFPEART